MDSNSKVRVLMFPWLGHGHVSPFLELAKKLSRKKFYIYFCSTPINLAPIKARSLSKDYFSSIELVELHLPSLPELPPHYHTTKGLPPRLSLTLTKAFDSASSTFSNILITLNPDLLITDFIQPWASEQASSLGIPAVLFMLNGAIVHNSIFPSDPASTTSIPNHILDLKNRVFQSLKESSNTMLIRSCREIEGNYMDSMSADIKKKLLPVGALVQDPGEEDERKEVTEWLDKKEPSSVVFVSFGSENYLSEREREELARGLLLSNVQFIWVLRFPEGEKMNIRKALPEEFMEIVGERGLIVEDWAPQKKILEHPNVGGFVSHCGWGSVIESLKYGVPIIALPMQLDQQMNCRLVVEIGVGLKIKRDKKGNFEREEVAQVIKEVVTEKTGEKLRIKAKEFSECIRKKGDTDVDESVDELIKLCGKKSN